MSLSTKSGSANGGPARAPVLFSLDLEDHLEQYPADGGRYQDITMRLLDVLEQRGVRGTVFTVGRVAETAPWLVQEVARRGHEVACHSQNHVPLTRETAASFREGTARAREALQQASGQPVAGYRAPVFSLTPAVAWAVPLLEELGFTYSSSIMPVRHPLHGFPGAPRRPFRWHGRLVEFPCPVARLGPLTLPFLGGIYLRYLPLGLVRRWLVQVPTPAWTYLHPYDFDGAEGYRRFPDRSVLLSLLLSARRGGTLDKLAALLPRHDGTRGEDGAAGRGETFVQWAEDAAFVQGLPAYAPPEATV